MYSKIGSVLKVTLLVASCYGFFLTNNADAVVNEKTDKVIFFHHSTGKNGCLHLFMFGIRDSETDSWIFMFITHGNAPFVLAVAAGIIDSLMATGIIQVQVM